MKYIAGRQMLIFVMAPAVLSATLQKLKLLAEKSFFLERECLLTASPKFSIVTFSHNELPHF